MVLLAVDDTIRRFIEYRGSLFGLHAPVVFLPYMYKGVPCLHWYPSFVLHASGLGECFVEWCCDDII